MFKNRVMHFPEAATGGGEFRGFRGVFRVRVRFVQGKVAKNEGKFLAEVFLHALDDRIGVAAVGALVIAVFDEDDGGGEVALDVVVGGDWDFSAW